MPRFHADVARAIAIATGGAAAFAVVEYPLTVAAYAGSSSLGAKLRLVALVATLALVLWALLVAGLAVAAIGYRAVTRRSLLALERIDVPRAWGRLATALVFGAALQRIAAWAIAGFKEPTLIATLIAVLGVVAGAAALLAGRGLVALARRGARRLDRLGAFNPLGRRRAAAILATALAATALFLLWRFVPAVRSYLSIRLAVSAFAIAFGGGFGALYLPRMRRVRTRRRARLVAAGALALTMTTLLAWGGDPETKYLAVTASPALERLVGVVRALNDVDRDGYGSLLGEADCAPWSAAIHPGDAVDLPDDGIDQNCDGHDFTMASITAPPGPGRPLPAAFQRDWNILLLTIDALRYDHTSFAGYARDTTPNLAKLVARSSTFTFAQSPAAGTMASIPAILTSRYFHSGIALDETRPAGSPPGIRAENTTLPEIMKRAGYRTGVIGSHEWWTGWGLEQGVDDYDNSIGAKVDPRRVVADKVTDHALAWVSRQTGKWFLWAHYIDPHGIYVAHPDVVDYGSSDADLYDAEIKWTDQEVGRLLDNLARLPAYANTIVIITSDHGENMGEHNGTLGTHGTSLHVEQTHVPLVFYIPDNRPRAIPGAVTNLDIVPTVAALARIDVTDLRFEGRSLVPQLFYGEDSLDRIVFTETNAPKKQRAAIGSRAKLIYHLSSNVYELYDLAEDPRELVNLAPRQPPELATMKTALDAWLERVLYARDPMFNQAYRQIGDVLLAAKPAPRVPLELALPVQSGAIAVIGIGPADDKPWQPGGRADIHVYFHVTAPTPLGYRFALNVFPAGNPEGLQRGPTRATAEGAYPTNRWRAGDYVRERFPFNIPRDWTGVGVQLVVVDPQNRRETLDLGVIPLGSQAPAVP